MGTSNFPNGFKHGVTIRGIPILNTYNGNVYYVDSVNGSNGNDGTFNYPMASVNYLFSSDKIVAGDKIICKPGHVETLAADLAWDIAGICVIMDGEGTSKAYFNITAAAGGINVTGAGGTLINPKFVTGIDAVVRGVLVAAADFSMYNVEYFDAAGLASTIQVLTTAAAHRLTIDGYRFFASTTGTQKTDGIKTVGAIDKLVLRNINITGDFSTAPVDISAAATNIELDWLNLNNTNTDPQPAMEIHANTTGFAENVKCRVDSGTDYVSSTAKLQWGAMCQGYNTDGSGGAAIGSATDITAAVDSVGVNTSTIISKVDSAGIQASTIQSKVDSTGVLAGGASTGASAAASQVASVGVQTSAAQSIVLSQAARTDSKADSVGIQTSTVDSLARSVGIQTSVTHSVAASVASRLSVAESKIDSTGLGVSTGISQIGSTGLGVSTAISQIGSTGLGVSTAHSKVDSTGLGVSTAISTIASTGILAGGASTGVSTVRSKVDSAGIQVSTVQSKVDSVGAHTSAIISQATSLGLEASLFDSIMVSRVASFCLVISTINSKT